MLWPIWGFRASKFTHQGDQRRENGSSPYEFDVPLVDQVAQSVDSTLKKLGTDYLDALILHGQMGSWVSPSPFTHTHFRAPTSQGPTCVLPLVFLSVSVW